MPCADGEQWIEEHLRGMGRWPPPETVDEAAYDQVRDKLAVEAARLERVRHFQPMLEPDAAVRHKTNQFRLWMRPPNKLLGGLRPDRICHDLNGFDYCRKALKKEI
jgi:hypothetical protein